MGVQTKYSLKLPSAAEKPGEIIMQNVFPEGFAINNRPEGSILFSAYDEAGICSEDFESADLCDRWSRFLSELDSWRENLLKAGGYVVKRREVRSPDWVDRWKQNFTPVEIGDRWLVIPPWHREGNFTNKNRIILTIEPGVAFGTGNHPSTRLILNALDSTVKENSQYTSFLDAGCGSGILSLAAARLELKNIIAVEREEIAASNARKNVELNGLSSFIEIIEADIRDISLPQFDVIAVNCLPQIIEKIAPCFVSSAHRETIILISGFKEKHAEDLKSFLQSFYLEVIDTASCGEWGLFVARKKGDKT